jgi:hypothetical protein
VHAQDLHAPGAVGPVHQHLAVEAPGAQQRRVEDLGPVGGRQQRSTPAVRVEAVELGQQLVERLLALVVAAAEPDTPRARPSASSSSMKMMAGARLARLLEQVAHARRAHAHEHLHELAAGDAEEGHPGLAGHRLGQQRLARARRAHEQHAARACRAPSGVDLRGSFRKATTSCSSALASSTPATSAKVTPVTRSTYTLARLRPMLMKPPSPWRSARRRTTSIHRPKKTAAGTTHDSTSRSRVSSTVRA